MKTRITLFVISFLGILLMFKDASGQDPNFSQFFTLPIYYNPAYTGLNAGLRARFTFRDQWPNLPVDFRAYNFSADLGDRNLPGAGGLGLVVNSNNEGIGFINDLFVGLTAAVRIRFSENVISQVGIKAAIMQKRINWNDFVFTDQLDEKYGNTFTGSFSHPDNDSKIFPDFGAGGLIQFTSNNTSLTGVVGVAVDHLFQPDESFLSTAKSPLPRKWIFHADLIIPTGSNSGYSGTERGSAEPLKLNPGIMYEIQNGLSILQVGMNLLKYNIYLGAWYKGSMGSNSVNTMVILAGYRYMINSDISIKLMYSYDLQISGPLQGAGGSHEISLILEFEKLRLIGGGYSYRGRGRGNSSFECTTF